MSEKFEITKNLLRMTFLKCGSFFLLISDFAVPPNLHAIKVLITKSSAVDNNCMKGFVRDKLMLRAKIYFYWTFTSEMSIHSPPYGMQLSGGGSC